MPLNFGILQPVNISGQMLAGEQEAMRNQLAQQQLKTGALQQEKSQLELADFKTKQAGLDRFLQVSEANGKTGSPEELANSFLSYAMSQRDPQLIMSAQTLAQAANERKAYMASRMPSAAPSAAPSVAPVAASSVASMEAPAAAPMSNAINQLAPVNQPVSNALAQPTNTQALEQRILDLQTRFPTAAKTEIAMLTKQLEEARKTHTVGRNLVTGAGNVIFTAPQDITPTEISRLTTERNALPKDDPRRAVYDRAINDIGAQARIAQERLNFDRSKFNWERNNPGFELKQSDDGTFYGVNKRTLQAVPVTVGGAVPSGSVPSGAAPAISGGGIPGARMPAESVAVAGTPFKGKSEGLKPIPANINLAIIKNNQGIQQLNDTIKLLEENPDAVGWKGFVPGTVLNRADPEGVNARAGVADIGSLVLHDRSGAAVTAAEAPRLVPFIPLITDDKDTAIKKLKRMRDIATQEQSGLEETYSKSQGYMPNPTVGKFMAATPQQIPPIYATNGKQRIVSTDGGQTWNPVQGGK